MFAKISCKQCDYYGCTNSEGRGKCHKYAPTGTGFALVNGDTDWCSEFSTDISKLPLEDE